MGKNKASIILNFVLAIIILILVFQSYFMSLYCHFAYQNPVIFDGFEIKIPPGIAYRVGERSIVFYDFTDPESFLSFEKFKAIDKEYLLTFYMQKKFSIIKSYDFSFKNHPGFIISYLDNDWRYNRGIYIPSKKVSINYQGSKKKYDNFKIIIENLKFPN